MKKFLNILFMVLFSLNVSHSQSTIRTDNLFKQKKVKTSTQFECDKEGKNCKAISQFTYDTLGRIIKSVSFSRGKPFSISYYSYNQFDKQDTVYLQFAGQKKYVSELYMYKGALLTEHYNCYVKEGCMLTKKYEYLNNGLLRKEIEFRDSKADTEITYIYDKARNIIKTQTRFIKSNVSLKERKFHNSKKELIKTVSYSPTGERQDSTKYKYDSFSRLIYLDWTGGLNYKNTYKYDKAGNEIEYISKSLNGQVTDHRRTIYTNGLESTRIHYETNKIKKYFKFTYSYYKNNR